MKHHTKKIYALLAGVILTLFLLSGCGKVTLHCDNCGKEISVSKSSGMDESWTIYCSDCEKALGLDTVVPER